MFLWHYQHSFDDKSRLMIPARYREELEGGAYLTQGFEKCLLLMTETHFTKLYESIAAMSLTDPTARLLRRMIFPNAIRLEMDKVGRVLVPDNLRLFAGLDGEVVLAGHGEYIEIWAPAEWEKQTSLLNDADANARRFEALNVSIQP